MCITQPPLYTTIVSGGCYFFVPSCPHYGHGEHTPTAFGIRDMMSYTARYGHLVLTTP